MNNKEEIERIAREIVGIAQNYPTEKAISHIVKILKVKILKNNMALDDGYFVITRLSKDDLRAVFKDNAKALEIIEKLDDCKMRMLAEKMAADYLNQLYWISLKTIFEDNFLEEADNE